MKTIMVCQKVMRILILTLLFLNFAPCFGQDKMELVNNFMESMLKSNYSDTEIIHRFIKTDTTSTKSAEFAKSLIQYLRTDFTQKSIKANELSYIRYREAPESTQDMIISERKMSDVYFVIHKGKRLIPVLIEGNKIAAISTMNKGGKRVFIIF